MEYSAWAPQYDRIRRAFGFPFDREEAAARTLTSLLADASADRGVEELTRRIRGRLVVVVGLAPGAGAPPVWRLPATSERAMIIAADGATARCLEAGLTPDVIVTDLDGPVPAEVTANARGAVVVVHAHGDNVEQLHRWVPEFSGPVIGSWAGPPTRELLDAGGFTDGDRAVFLAEHVGAARILLWGFDFTTVDEGAPAERSVKLRKLETARALLEWLARRATVPIEEWRRDGTTVRYGTAGIGPLTQ